MAEKQPRYRRAAVAATIGILCAPAALDGCTFSDTPAVPRCYDKPFPSEVTAKPSDIGGTIHLRMKRNQVAEMQPPNTATLQKAAEGVVFIAAGRYTGTGFVTKNTSGEQVVLTAAHVIGTEDLNGITITTNRGKQSHPDGGCYIYENSGEFKTINSSKFAVEHDMAVLTLPKPIVKNSNTLQLARYSAVRGEHTFFVNHQQQSTPERPVAYGGIVLANAKDAAGYTVLTGADRISALNANAQYSAEHVTFGASGGPMFNSTGDVAGMTTGSLDVNRPDLAQLFNTQIDGAELDARHGFIPTIGGLMSVALMREALELSFDD